ncbi:MAG TPA: DUF429 domain-containing protein [Micromonosporaceae bacterium]
MDSAVVPGLRAVGVDGYAGGWVAVELHGGEFVRAWCAGTLATLLGQVPADAVGVDMPLGLLGSGWRSADLHAAAALGARRSSVFRVAPRPVWAAGSHQEASSLCRELTGAGLSMQAWRLGEKILEAEAYRATGAHELFEVHPELVFAGLAGAPLRFAKKTWNGQAARRALLAGVGIELPGDLGPAGVVPVDDVLDAAAVAWCADRIARDAAHHVPDPAIEHDELGRPIVIWYARRQPGTLAEPGGGSDQRR